MTLASLRGGEAFWLLLPLLVGGLIAGLALLPALYLVVSRLAARGGRLKRSQIKDR